jgi:glycosyltransferase involved in cell wall biosynthesis
MNVLFAYNGRVEVDEQGLFYGNELNDKLVERYRFFGDQVTFLVRTRPISAKEKASLIPFNSTGFSIIGLPEINSPALYLKKSRELNEQIEAAVKSADVLVARLPSLIGRRAIFYARKYQKPYLVEAVGCPWDALWNHSKLGKLVAPYGYLAMKKYIQDAPFVLYVTNRFLQERYPTSGISVGVSDVVLDPVSEEVLEKRLAKIEGYTGSEKWVLGTAAGLDVKYKGQQYVIRAVANLAKQGKYFLYKLAGKGNGSYLKSVIEQSGALQAVEIAGQIPHHKVFDFLDDIDIYIQPSKQEGLPRAVVEAMSRACPCIGSRTGGIPELLPAAFIFSKGNVAGIESILKNLDKESLKKMARENFEKVKEFTPERLNAKRLAFYRMFRDSYK